MEWQIDRAIDSGSFFGKRKVNRDEEKPGTDSVLSSSSRLTIFNFHACVASWLPCSRFKNNNSAIDAPQESISNRATSLITRFLGNYQCFTAVCKFP